VDCSPSWGWKNETSIVEVAFVLGGLGCLIDKSSFRCFRSLGHDPFKSMSMFVCCMGRMRRSEHDEYHTQGSFQESWSDATYCFLHKVCSIKGVRVDIAARIRAWTGARPDFTCCRIGIIYWKGLDGGVVGMGWTAAGCRMGIRGRWWRVGVPLVF
jgi:hypothetical protein